MAAKFEELAKVAMKHLDTDDLAKVLKKTKRTAQRAAEGHMTYPAALLIKEELIKRGVKPVEIPALDPSLGADTSEWASLGERLHEADATLFQSQLEKLRVLVEAVEIVAAARDDVTKPLGTEGS